MTCEPMCQGPSPGRQAVGFYEHFMGLSFVNTFHSLLLNLVDLLKMSKFSAFGRLSVSWSRACGICSSMNALQPLASWPPGRVVEPSFASAAMSSAATWQGAGRPRLSLSVVHQGASLGKPRPEGHPSFPSPAPGLSCCGSIVALKRVKKLDLLSDSTLGGRELVFYVAR